MAKLTLTDTSAGYALAATLNANNALIEAALENTLSRDGTSPNTMSAALDMNSNLINNLAVPVNDQSAATKKYVDDIVTGFTSAATFSPALPYDITGSWDFEALADFEAGLRIWDAVGGADNVAFTHDGANLNVIATNTGIFDMTGFTALRIASATAAALGQFYNTAGPAITAGYDASNYIRFSHDATDASIEFGSTTDLNIAVASSITDINIGADIKMATGKNIKILQESLTLSRTSQGNALVFNDNGSESLVFQGDGSGNVITASTGSGGLLTWNTPNLFDETFFEERAAAAADRTGYGQLWVRTSDGVLMYTGDNGTDYVVDLTAA